MEGMEGEIGDERVPRVEKMTKKIKARWGEKLERSRIKEQKCNREYWGGGENEQGWLSGGWGGGVARWRHLICSIITKPLVELWTDASAAVENQFTASGGRCGALMVQMFRFKGPFYPNWGEEYVSITFFV